MEIVTLEEAALYELVAKVIDHFKSELNPTVEKWVSPERAMEILNITSKTTLQKMRNEGEIRFSQPKPKIILYDLQSIYSFLEKHAHNTF